MTSLSSVRAFGHVVTSNDLVSRRRVRLSLYLVVCLSLVVKLDRIPSFQFSYRQRRKPWGTRPPPQNLEWGTPMYNVPQILTFSLYFSLIQSVSRISVARAKEK